MTVLSSTPSIVPMAYTMAVLLSFMLAAAAPAPARDRLSPSGRQIPALDTNAPKRTKTASFGLG